MSIGSHRDEGSSFEDVSDDDGEVGGIEQEDQEQNKSLDIEKEEDTNKKTKKKKNKGFNLKDLESVQQTTEGEQPQGEITENNPDQENIILSSILAGVTTNKGDKKQKKNRKR